MTRQNNSAYADHPWRKTRVLATPEEVWLTDPSAANLNELASQQDIPALRRHLDHMENQT